MSSRSSVFVAAAAHSCACAGRQLVASSSNWQASTSIDLLHSGAACARPRRRRALRHAGATACRLVHLHHDRVHHALKLLLLGLELVLLRQLVLVEPIQRVLHGFLDLLLVSVLELV